MAEEATTTEQSAEEQPKKALNLQSIGLAVQGVVMLALMGLVAKVVFMTPKPVLDKKTLEEHVISSIRDENADIQYFPVEELIVNIDGNHTVKAQMVLELSNSEILKTFQDRHPIVRSRVLSVLSSQQFSRLDRIQGKLELKDQLVQILNEELARSGYEGTGTVRDLFFVDLVLI